MIEGDCLYVLGMVNDVSGFAYLEPAVSCTGEVAARTILKWYTLFGPPRVFVSDGACHCFNTPLKVVAARLGAAYQLSMVNTSWMNGTVERMKRKVVHTFKNVLSGRLRPVREWPLALRAVQWGINSVYCERLRTIAYQIILRRALQMMLSILAGEGGAGRTIEEGLSRAKMQELVAGR